MLHRRAVVAPAIFSCPDAALLHERIVTTTPVFTGSAYDLYQYPYSGGAYPTAQGLQIVRRRQFLPLAGSALASAAVAACGGKLVSGGLETAGSRSGSTEPGTMPATTLAPANSGGPRNSYSTSSALTTIGPATPEQISLFLPAADSVPYTATATCRYKRTADASWTTGHPLHRIRNDFSSGPFGDTLRHGFAWPIIDLTPGTAYDVEVTLTDGSSTVHTLTTTTRALPAAAGAANKTANSVATIHTQLASLNPGDVLEIANGTYALSSFLDIMRSGTANNPIYIRGQSRTGVVISRATRDTFFVLRSCSHVVIENLTIQGCGIDGDGFNWTPAFHGADGYNPSYVTIRNIISTGIDRFVYCLNAASALLVYNNTATGNNVWSPYMGSITWNDDGVHLPGEGNCAFQNTMTGFGDTFAYCSGENGGASTANAVHFYRNEIRNSCDDAIEVDDAEACCTWYDNRLHNGMNADSLDGLCGGPWLSARNVYINLYRGRPHKWNSQNSGQFLYNNTIITPQAGSTVVGTDDLAAWYQPSNGPQNAFGYRNNVHIYTGPAAKLLQLDSTGYNPVDWTHNSWYPDNDIELGGITSGATLAAFKANMAGAPRTPVFSGQTEFMFQETICSANPWQTAVTLPATSATEVTATYLPTPASGSALKNTGVAIANITSGATGAAPDRGAVMEGRAVVAYGDQTGVVPTWVPSTAWQWTPIIGTRWNDVMKSVADGGVAPSQVGDPIGSSYDAQWDFGGVAYSPKNHEMWLFGGGHSGTTINALSRWNLGSSSPSVSMMCAPTPVAVRNADWDAGVVAWQAAAYHTAGGGAEARPKSPHAYSNNRYFDDIDEFVSMGLGAVHLPGGSNHHYYTAAAFPRSGTSWRAQGNFPNIENAGSYGAQNQLAFESHDRTAVYYAGKNSPLYKFTSAGVKSTIGSNVGNPYGAQAAARSATEALIVGGYELAQGWRARFIDLTTGVVTTATVSGFSWPTDAGDTLQFFGVVWCQAIGKYIALLVSRNDITYAVNALRIVTLEPTGASTLTAVNVTLTGTAPTLMRIANCLHIDPAYGAILIATSPSQSLMTLKVA